MSLNFINSLISEASNMMLNLQQRPSSHLASFFQPSAYQQLNNLDLSKKTELLSNSSEQDQLTYEDKTFNPSLIHVSNDRSKQINNDGYTEISGPLHLTKMIIKQQQDMISQLLKNGNIINNNNANLNLTNPTPQISSQQVQLQQLQLPQQLQMTQQIQQLPSQISTFQQNMNIPQQIQFQQLQQQQLQMPSTFLQFPLQTQQQFQLQPEQIFSQQFTQPSLLPVLQSQQPQLLQQQQIFQQGTLSNNAVQHVNNGYPVSAQLISNTILSQPIELQQVPAVIIPKKKKNKHIERDTVPQEEDSLDDESDQLRNSLKKAIRKRQKKMNNCGHLEREHYAKGMCSNCYHRYGRTKKPWLCSHDKLYACGLCQNCYINKYNQRKRTEIDGIQVEEKTQSGEIDLHHVEREIEQKITEDDNTSKIKAVTDQAADGDDEREDEEEE